MRRGTMRVRVVLLPLFFEEITLDWACFLHEALALMPFALRSPCAWNVMCRGREFVAGKIRTLHLTFLHRLLLRREDPFLNLCLIVLWAWPGTREKKKNTHDTVSETYCEVGSARAPEFRRRNGGGLNLVGAAAPGLEREVT